MKYIKKILDAIYIAVRYALAAILGFAIILTFVEVIRRYLFGKSFIWSEELMRYLFVYVGFIGGAAAFREKGLACFDLVTKKISSPKARKIISLVIDLGVIGFSLYMGIKGVQVVGLPSIARQTSAGLNLPMPVVYAAIPIGFFLMVLFGIENIVTILSRNGDEVED